MKSVKYFVKSDFGGAPHSKLWRMRGAYAKLIEFKQIQLLNPSSSVVPCVSTYIIESITGKPCEKMPATFSPANGPELTKSSKRDVYYPTMSTACSCPGFT
jgi:hypothetical protein